MIDVLLATFNGATYLPDLFESLEHQTYPDWRVVIRDDGSTDGTLSVIEEWAERHAERIRLLRDGRARLGPCANFAAVLDASDAPYFMFCDQDDVWLPNKMNLLFGSIRRIERQKGQHTPILAHSDLVIVDEYLNELHPSRWCRQGFHGSSSFYVRDQLMLQNCVTGCASIGNAALRKRASPIPTEAFMHDWWVALVAAYMGELIENETPTVLYRQHQKNVVGTKNPRLFAVIARFLQRPSAAVERTRRTIEKTQSQAGAFAKQFSDSLDTESYNKFMEYAKLREKNFLKRKLFLFRWNLWPKDWIRGAILSSFL